MTRFSPLPAPFQGTVADIAAGASPPAAADARCVKGLLLGAAGGVAGAPAPTPAAFRIAFAAAESGSFAAFAGGAIIGTGASGGGWSLVTPVPLSPATDSDE